MTQRDIQHLYWRAGFGILPKQSQQLKSKSRTEIVNELFSKSARVTPLEIDIPELKHIDFKSIQKDKEALKKLGKILQDKLSDFNEAWIERLNNPKELLRERMTLFWANHFVCRENNTFFAQQYNNTLREHALGNFRSFTKAISKEVAMIRYLNLQQNRKKSPNENFARELMELFTLGKGNYTEQDIKESARAFTGYSHDISGAFKFAKWAHDYDEKTFFNKKGNFTGDDIIDLIVQEKQCARFVCKKVYSYFVNTSINENHIESMVGVFYPKYDIEDLMRFVFMSDWFYEEENIGTKIKSPIDLIVGLNQNVPIQFKEQKHLLTLQKLLGQVLLLPPNVAGWKDGTQWIDSNTILLRLRLASILLNSAHISTKQKGQFNDRLDKFIKRAKEKQLPFNVNHDWKHFEQQFKNVSIDDLKNHLIMVNLSTETQQLLDDFGKSSKQEHCIQLMSLPEYQMC
ncbi:MAG: DUF1800 domain-containing protein [Flavobacteriaceae bacterium]|nr:DUF1800 domain-containing protein [Flavobacteriaceae bacterium]